jgi:hypothetical protein
MKYGPSKGGPSKGVYNMPLRDTGVQLLTSSGLAAEVIRNALLGGGHDRTEAKEPMSREKHRFPIF